LVNRPHPTLPRSTEYRERGKEERRLVVQEGHPRRGAPTGECREREKKKGRAVTQTE
jgi:hypothetical protein